MFAKIISTAILGSLLFVATPAWSSICQYVTLPVSTQELDSRFEKLILKLDSAKNRTSILKQALKQEQAYLQCVQSTETDFAARLSAVEIDNIKFHAAALEMRIIDALTRQCSVLKALVQAQTQPPQAPKENQLDSKLEDQTEAQLATPTDALNAKLIQAYCP